LLHNILKIAPCDIWREIKLFYKNILPSRCFLFMCNTRLSTLSCTSVVYITVTMS